MNKKRLWIALALIPVFAIIAFIAISGSNTAQDQSSSTDTYDIVLGDQVASLVKNAEVDHGEILQSIDASDTAVAIAAKNKDLDLFISYDDANFDGYPDLAVLTHDGENGTNDFYDYYLYNPKTHRLEKDSVLADISNPTVDAAKKQIVSYYKKGRGIYSRTYQFNGTTFIDKGEVTEELQ